MKKFTSSPPKKILLLEAEKHAPTSARDAAKLTRTGETAVRSLKMRRFGRTDYVKITDLNHFALKGGRET